MSKNKPQPVGHSPIQHVLLCERFVRRRRGRRAQATSLPGHLLQLTVRGQCHHNICGREDDVRPGTLVWFHEDESVTTHIQHAPWTYFSVNFIAPSLEPPAYADRMDHRRLDLLVRFEALHKAWRGRGLDPLRRQLAVQSALCDLLSRIAPTKGEPGTNHDHHAANLWWRIESHFRRDLRALHTLDDLVELTGKSPATIARACQQVHGMPPMKRLKEIRLSMARGLARRSTLRIAEIAEQVGYARQHELTRDFRKAFGHPPTTERQWFQSQV